MLNPNARILIRPMCIHLEKGFFGGRGQRVQEASVVHEMKPCGYPSLIFRLIHLGKLEFMRQEIGMRMTTHCLLSCIAVVHFPSLIFQLLC